MAIYKTDILYEVNSVSVDAENKPPPAARDTGQARGKECTQAARLPGFSLVCNEAFTPRWPRGLATIHNAPSPYLSRVRSQVARSQAWSPHVPQEYHAVPQFLDSDKLLFYNMDSILFWNYIIVSSGSNVS